MARKYLTMNGIRERLGHLEQLSRQQALTGHETQEIDRLRMALDRKLLRLPDQITECEAKLARLRAEYALISSL